MTRFISCTLLLLACLAGCAATGTSNVGNFSDAPAPVQEQLADAAVKQLVLLYPPGSTRFNLQQATADAFGRPLAAGLRAQGYALEDLRPVPDASVTAATPALASAPSAGLPLGYVLDQAAGPQSYRITLQVGSQTLTRVYLAHEGRLVPAGAWVRKE